MIFLESPWPILFLGIVTEAVFAVALLRTGRGVLLWGIVGVAAVTLSGLAVEHFVITDRKAIKNTLYEAAAAAEANDLRRLAKCVVPLDEGLLEKAREVSERVQIETVHLSGIDITIHDQTAVPTATAQVNVLVTGHDRLGEYVYRSAARHVTVELRRQGGKWLVSGGSIDGIKVPKTVFAP
jgi:hypothetical protein